MGKKEEPWFKPRADEDADDAMLDAKFGRGSGGGGGDGSRHNRSCVTVLAVGAALGLILTLLGIGGVKAVAAPAPVYHPWVMPPGPLCVQENGMPYWHAAKAASYYNAAANLNIVTKPVCTGFPIRRTIHLRTYKDPKVGACAVMVRTKQSWMYAYGRWTWISEATEIRFNVAPEAKSRCWAKSTGVAHVTSHELGHALGLQHNTEASVMGSWAYWWPTVLDVTRVNARYQQ